MTALDLVKKQYGDWIERSDLIIAMKFIHLLKVWGADFDKCIKVLTDNSDKIIADR